MNPKSTIYLSSMVLYLFAGTTICTAQNSSMEYSKPRMMTLKPQVITLKELPGDSLQVEISLQINDPSVIKSKEKVIISPSLYSSETGDTYNLPAFLLAGKGRQRLEYRQALLDKKRSPDFSDYYLYKGIIPFTPWMAEAKLALHTQTVRCAECPAGSDLQSLPIDIELLPKVRYVMKPHVSLVMPEVEPIKSREETGTTKIEFQSGKSVILPIYKGNDNELTKINEAIRMVLADSLASIKAITLTAYSSPDGSYKLNERLARTRAAALKSYIEKSNNLKGVNVSVRAVAEDWNTLRNYVDESQYVWKDKVLTIIDSSDLPDVKERKLKVLNGGQPYQFMLKEWFPLLRRTAYQLQYSVQDFTVEQGREVMKTRPGLLSLNEMFHVANSYPKGSEEFNQVFDVAVRLFPNDPIANINAAAVALEKGDAPSAKKYLGRAKDDPQTSNNWAVYYMLLQDLETAKKYLSKSNLDLKEVKANLNEIKLKEENNALFEKYKIK